MMTHQVSCRSITLIRNSGSDMSKVLRPRFVCMNLVLLSHKNQHRVFCYTLTPNVVFRPIFIRIGGPEWTGDQASGVKRALRPMSRHSEPCWAMPIGNSRCTTTAFCNGAFHVKWFFAAPQRQSVSRLCFRHSILL